MASLRLSSEPISVGFSQFTDIISTLALNFRNFLQSSIAIGRFRLDTETLIISAVGQAVQIHSSLSVLVFCDRPAHGCQPPVGFFFHCQTMENLLTEHILY